MLKTKSFIMGDCFPMSLFGVMRCIAEYGIK